jgi:hypothetical protein
VTSRGRPYTPSPPGPGCTAGMRPCTTPSSADHWSRRGSAVQRVPLRAYS